MKRKHILVVAVVAFVTAVFLLSQPAAAQDRPTPLRPPRPPATRPAPLPPPLPLHLDQRYRHDHYYPSRGHVVPALPGGSIGLSFGNGNLFFHGGVWFEPRGGRFVVVAPPIGVYVPMLPPAYVSLWIGGAPYYYANGVYYAPAPGQGYTVVAPPLGAEVAQPAPPPAQPPLPDPIIYPRNGQSAAQTEIDRRECNRWATTLPSALADAAVFQRAVAACLDGRGYTVR
jgi:hypothetical protein